MYNDSLVLLYNFENISELNGNNSYVVDVSASNNSGNNFHGISYGYVSGNLQFTADQYGGVANNGEFDITCTGGDSACEFTDFKNYKTDFNISSGLAMQDGATGTAYIMYSEENVHERFSANPPFVGSSGSFIGVRYNSGWEYDSNDAWHDFTPVATDTLVAKLDLTGDTATALDIQPNYTSGKYGDAFEFDDDYIMIDTFNNFPTSQISVSFWIKTNGAADGIVSYAVSGTDNEFLVYEPNNIAFYINGISVNTGIDINDNQWHHVALTWQDSDDSVKGYKDGAEVYSGSINTGVMTAEGCLVIAQEQDAVCGDFDSAQAMPGKLDEIFIYNRILSPDEVSQHYLSNLKKHNSTLWHLYTNQTKNATDQLDAGDYTYQAFAIDNNSNTAQTEQRTITISSDLTNPIINFTSPTPDDSASQTATNVEVNISITEENLDTLIYDWNGTNYTMYNDSLVLMYNFDNISNLDETYANGTIVYDSSPAQNNGTISDAIWNITGKYGGAMQFDGSGDVITASHSSSLGFTSSYTFAAWIYTTSDRDYDVYYARSTDGSSADIEIYSSITGQDLTLTHNRNNGGTFEYSTNDGFQGTSGSGGWGDLSLNTWTHLVVTFSSNTWKVYFNGVQVGNTITGVIDPLDTSLPTNLGGRAGFESSADFLLGNMDEVRIWNRSLSADEIYQQYTSNLNKFNSTHWNLYVNQSKNATQGLDTGDYTYQAFTIDTNSNTAQTGQRTITISSSSCPSTPQNWNVLMSDYTVINSLCNLTGYNITFSGGGNFTINNDLYVDQFIDFSGEMTIFMKPSGILYYNAK